MRMRACQCPSCGAPLDRLATASDADCDYCGTRIEHLNLLPSGAEVAPRSTLPGDILELDHEWEAYRATWLPRDGNGTYFVPDPEHCRTGGWITGGVGAGAAIALLCGGLIPLAILPVAVAVGVMLVLRRQAGIGSVYTRSLAHYRATRQSLLRQHGLTR
jgi:hypothetical protein